MLSDRRQNWANTQGLGKEDVHALSQKAIYKYNLTVMLHNAGELLDIQPARAAINKSNPL